MLVGEPGKMDNCISTVPQLKKLKTEDINGNVIFLDYAYTNNTARHVCKTSCRTVLYEGESIKYAIPTHMENEELVALSPIKETQPPWVYPTILEVKNGQIEIQNTSPFPVIMEKNTPFADVMKVVEINTIEKANVQKIIHESSDKSHYSRPKILDTRADYTDQVTIDPDNQLQTCWKKAFRELCSKFSDVLNPNLS